MCQSSCNSCSLAQQRSAHATQHQKHAPDQKSVIVQELRGQLHNDSQQQQDLLDQQHDFIQDLEAQQQQLRVSVNCSAVHTPSRAGHRLWT